MLGCDVKLRRPDFVGVQIWTQSPGCDGSSAFRLDRIIEPQVSKSAKLIGWRQRAWNPSIHEYNGAEHLPFRGTRTPPSL